ncbi:high affinity immunoglobulin alpha and immunoglobulin mu Fc receptor isoform X2 [Vulpes lagopus]|uniref:high affinity immunoglobulin alpha and immunoglobulin mu Fc receptor isoform X2 n=2 Tax=Vulpes lagopus TaxID=494514 RepID=UPI001BC8E0DD|nr:high affinity immunoglobulin alpha and immunoglobulin mu Fc receptor isoform X2 [Vulpes lagopus]
MTQVSPGFPAPPRGCRGWDPTEGAPPLLNTETPRAGTLEPGMGPPGQTHMLRSTVESASRAWLGTAHPAQHCASGRPGVTNRRAGWKMPVLLMVCLLQAAGALKGPRLVSGEPGGAVTIRCHYAPLTINMHDRKYWCRLSPVTHICHTIVSTTHYTHLRYRGRVALTDFPRRSLFVVTLTQLSPDDVGRYRCGIGNTNNMFFFSMNLTVSAGPSGSIPTATPAATELVTGPFGTASPAANRRTPGATQTIGRQGTGWAGVAGTPGTTAEGRQTLGTTGAGALGTGSQGAASVWATVPIPESPASAIGGVSDTTEDVWVWDPRGSVANRARPSEEGGETATEADGAEEETERVRAAPDVAAKVTGTCRPSTLVSEKWVQGILREATTVSEPQALGSIEGTAPAAGVWTLGPTSREMASEEGATQGDLDRPAGDSDPQATPSQAPAAGSVRPLGKGSPMKSATPGEKNKSWILIPVSMLFPVTLVALGLLQKKLQRKRMTQETERTAGVTLIQMTYFLELSLQPDQLPLIERKMLRGDCPPQASLTVPERHPGPRGIEE